MAQRSYRCVFGQASWIYRTSPGNLQHVTLRTDLGSVTLLFRQPVASLQIRDQTTEQWKWVKPQDGTITVNTCDALSESEVVPNAHDLNAIFPGFLTGGYIKSTIHRCVNGCLT